MVESTVKEVTLIEAKTIIRGWFTYLLSKWIWIGLTGIVFGVLGILYASSQKAIYTAELTFAPDSERGSSMGGYAGIAAQFGLDVGGGTSFGGENLIQLLRSRRLLESTFLTDVDVNGKKQLLVQYLISLQSTGEKPNTSITNVTFSSDTKPGNRVRDSIMKTFIGEISAALDINKVDRRLDMISVKLSHTDELFAMLFVETLVDNVIQYYKDFKSQKSKQNVAILQRQTDSVHRLISGGIVSIVTSSDINVNPMMQMKRSGAQRKTVDVEANTAVYKELLTYLQAAKMSLLKETPFIQIIDSPILPLDKKKLGRAKAGVIAGFLGLFLATLFFSIKKMFW
jgi:hypothetical protein